jgi:hypothetical protein
MSIQGLWTSEFYGLYGWENSGVVVLEKGRALGGGRNHFSIGSYELSGDEFRMNIDIEYHGPPRTLFGSSDKHISITLNGQVRDDTIEGSVFCSESPRQSLMFRLTKRADVPG